MTHVHRHDSKGNVYGVAMCRALNMVVLSSREGLEPFDIVSSGATLTLVRYVA